MLQILNTKSYFINIKKAKLEKIKVDKSKGKKEIIIQENTEKFLSIEKSIDFLQNFLIEFKKIFRFWLFSYIIVFVGIIAAILIAKDYKTIGTAFLFAVLIGSLFLYFKNLKQEYKFISELKAFLDQKNNFF